MDSGRISIGRSPDCDWTLVDPTNQLSSRHCEIAWVGDGYAVADKSTNGTSLNGERLTAARRIAPGDVLLVGPYEIRVGTEEGMAQTAAPAPAPGKSAGEGSARPLASALAGLAATRMRQRKEIGVGGADPLAGNPLAAADPAVALAALAPTEAARAIADAVASIDRHNAAALMAMQQALRDTMTSLAPATIAAEAKLRPGLDDSARDAALWRAYVARAEKKGEGAFLDRFAVAFRRAYEKLAALS